MPEEKKEKKASSFFTPKGDKKKESFTFSDKIKDSKPAASKSFANRISSKIGKDGKPKQTIFERTKRDAPFLIAALVALLLLPFLYKFSGSVSEEPLITPGSEYSDFDPNRRDAFGFDMPGDPEGQISQLSGRDSLSLIKGWGSDEDENTDESALYAGDYSGSYEGTSDSARAAASDTNVDIEENTTNIYKKRAKAGTRAAFRRATKIAGLPPATRTRGLGDKLAVGNWGGRMKDAARKVQGDSPRTSPKPVSLQPLQAAAKPTRTAFGDTAAAQRQSKDALGKADAKQAILDAMVKPVEPGKFGGLTAADAHFGGGNADIKREFNSKPQTPWWWDMMKNRSQKLWERYWQRKWKWEDWLDDIKMHILGGILNCLITGDDDGDMGSMFGTGGGGKDAKCCGQKESAFFLNYPQYKGVDFETACEAFKKTDAGTKICKNGAWEKGTSKARRGFIGARLACLGIAGSKYSEAEASIYEASPGSPCVDLNAGNPPHYSIRLGGKAEKWKDHVYHWIVVRNYAPIALTGKTGKRVALCASHVGNNLKSIRYSAAGVASVYNMSKEDVKKWKTAKAVEEEIANLKDKGKPIPDGLKKRAAKAGVDVEKVNSNYKDNQAQLELASQLNTEDLNNACVIYLANGPTLDWGDFKQKTIAGLTEFIKDQKLASGSDDIEAMAENAFNQLDLFFVEGMASEKKLGYAKWGRTGNSFHCTEKDVSSGKCMLPMPYWDFFDAYVERSGTTTSNGTKNKVDKHDLRHEGEDRVLGAKCYFNNSARISCEDNDSEPMATVVFGRGWKGGQAGADQTNDIEVTAKFIPEKGKNEGAEQKFPSPAKVMGNIYLYRFSNLLVEGKNVEKDARGQVEWKLYRAKQLVGTASCQYNMAGDTSNRGVEGCKNPNQSPKCCIQLKGTGYEWVNGKCQTRQIVPPGLKEPNPDKEPNPAPNQDPNRNPNFGPDRDPNSPQGNMTRLAPVISFVSKQSTDRKVVVGDPKKEHFGNDLIPAAQNDKDPYQHCGTPNTLVMNSASAASFVKMVVKAYNEAYASEIAGNKMPRLSDKFISGDYPNDAEFIDALNIAADPKVAMADVPASAVCELGRDMVRMSRDKHVGNKKVPGRDQLFQNELGAFLAYVHPASIFYPATRHWGECDQRFQTKYAGDGGCKEIAKTNNVPNAYHHNNFNNLKETATKTIYDRKYEPSLISEKIGNQFFLKDLAKANANCEAFNSKVSSCGTNCYKEVNAYNSNAGCALMYRDENEAEGQACVAFAGDATMKVQDALNYVKAVCATGLSAKPWGYYGDNKTIADPSRSTSGGSVNQGTNRK